MHSKIYYYLFIFTENGKQEKKDENIQQLDNKIFTEQIISVAKFCEKVGGTFSNKDTRQFETHT